MHRDSSRDAIETNRGLKLTPKIQIKTNANKYSKKTDLAVVIVVRRVVVVVLLIVTADALERDVIVVELIGSGNRKTGKSGLKSASYNEANRRAGKFCSGGKVDEDVVADHRVVIREVTDRPA